MEAAPTPTDLSLATTEHPGAALRARAEKGMRRLLRVPEGPRVVGEDAVYRIFHVSIVLSGLRCLFSYVLLPIVAPLIGAATNVGPAIGIPVAIVALVFDVLGLRRFWLADHRWKWPMTALYATVMVLVAGLLIADLVHLAS